MADYKKTTRKLQINYKVTTGLPQIRSLNHSYIDPLPERAENGFSGCAGNASRPRNKLRPRSPFSDRKNAGNRTYPG